MTTLFGGGSVSHNAPPSPGLGVDLGLQLGHLDPLSGIRRSTARAPGGPWCWLIAMTSPKEVLLVPATEVQALWLHGLPRDQLHQLQSVRGVFQMHPFYICNFIQVTFKFFSKGILSDIISHSDKTTRWPWMRKGMLVDGYVDRCLGTQGFILCFSLFSLFSEVQEPAASAPPGSWLEMQNLRLHPDLLRSQVLLLKHSPRETKLKGNHAACSHRLPLVRCWAMQNPLCQEGDREGWEIDTNKNI